MFTQIEYEDVGINKKKKQQTKLPHSKQKGNINTFPNPIKNQFSIARLIFSCPLLQRLQPSFLSYNQHHAITFTIKFGKHVFLVPYLHMYLSKEQGYEFIA